MVSGPSTPVSAIVGLDRLSVKPGDEVIVSGRNLTKSITVDIGGVPAELQLTDKKSASFVLPVDSSPGLVQVVFKKGEIRLASFPLLNGDDLENVPISAVPLASICDSYIVKDKNGNLQRGEAQCGEALLLCTRDGETNCKANDDAPSALKGDLAAKVLTGQTVAGVAGTATPAPADCAADGATNCVAVALFPAIDKSTKLSVGNAAKIHASLSIAGVAGTMTDCSTDGSTNCLAVPAYPAANASGASAKIAAGDVLAGIAGTAGVRPSDCSTDGATDCVAVTNFPAVDKLTKLSVGNAARIRSSLTIAGVVGTLNDCSTDGSSGCVIVGPTYAAAITTGLAAKVLTGQSVAGISGSAIAAPANCAADGATDCVAVTNFPAVNRATNLAVGNLA